MGYQIGSQFKERIQEAFQKSIFIAFLKSEADKDPARLEDLIKNATLHYPQYIKEIEGLAEGSGIDLADLLLINQRHAYVLGGCSTVIFKDLNKTILAHNEDHESILGHLSYLLQFEEDGVNIFSHTYPGCLSGTSFSVNSYGVISTGNAITNPDENMGVCQTILSRAMLKGKTIQESIQLMDIQPRTGAYIYNFASLKTKESLNFEISSRNSCITEITDRYFHANHFVSSGMKEIGIKPNSLERYNQGCYLVQEKPMTHESAVEILDDDLIYRPNVKSPTPLGDYYSGTLGTVIFELAKEFKMSLYPPFMDRTTMRVYTFEDLTEF